MNIRTWSWQRSLLAAVAAGAVAATTFLSAPTAQSAADYTIETPERSVIGELIAASDEGFLIDGWDQNVWAGRDGKRREAPPQSRHQIGDHAYPDHVDEGLEVAVLNLSTGDVTRRMAPSSGVPGPEGVVSAERQGGRTMVTLTPWVGEERVVATLDTAYDIEINYLWPGKVFTERTLVDLTTGSTLPLRDSFSFSAFGTKEGLYYYTFEEDGVAQCFLAWGSTSPTCTETFGEPTTHTGLIRQNPETYDSEWLGSATTTALLLVDGYGFAASQSGEVYWYKGGVVHRLTPEGTAQPVTPKLTEKAEVAGLSLSPWGLGGGDDRRGDTCGYSGCGDTAWIRDASGRTTVLPGRATSALLSAGRAAYFAENEIRMLDGGKLSTSLSAHRLLGVSGPYLLLDRHSSYDVPTDVRGRRVSMLKGESYADLFGPLYLAITWRECVKPDGITTWGCGSRSLTDSRTGEALYTDTFQDWSVGTLAGRFIADSSLLLDRISGRSYNLGDDYRMQALSASTLAALTPDGSLAVYDLTNLGTALPEPMLITDVKPGTATPVSLDGDRIAYVNAAGDVQVKILPFGGTEAPIFLGLVDDQTTQSVAKPWKPEIDLHKPVAAGTLVIKNSAGSVVREIATPATSTGSLRGLTWDTKNASGQAAPLASTRGNSMSRIPQARLLSIRPTWRRCRRAPSRSRTRSRRPRRSPLRSPR